MHGNPTSYEQLQSYREEDKDYKISDSGVRSGICVFSPHGGKIEPGVSEVVLEVAGSDFSWYLFEGIQMSNNYRDLHITSHLFNEPRAVSLLGRHSVAVAIHGARNIRAEVTYLGGKDVRNRRIIGDFLRRSGFNVPDETPSTLLGTQSNNICNRSMSGKGVQLEISRSQRQRFFYGDFSKLVGRRRRTDIFKKYIDAIRAALQEMDDNF
jgi:phage replication-related protein YjqB (UPF0714/DUF867 family)